MEDEGQTKSDVNWKFFAWVGGGLIVLFGCFGWALLIRQSKQSVAAPVAETSAVQAPVPVAAEPVKAGSEPRGCYVGQKPNLFHKTAQTRKDFADDNTKQLYSITDSDVVIIATAAGDDNEILMYSTAPENAAALRKLIAAFKPNPGVRDKFCDEGFAEVQFVLRDENMKQTLITKWQTSVVERMRHANQYFGASPM